ncbi:MAG: hypothetical protein ABIS47_14170 [Acidimicrobiales bacterium]
MPRCRSALVTAALAVVVLLGTFVATPSVAAAAPTVPDYGAAIDPFAAYVGQTTCDPTDKPGTVALRDLLEATYPATTPIGISRACSVGGQSEHKEGRAYDWGVNAFDPAQKALADDFLAWLLATDRYGNVNAMARRFGLMYVIWNNQVWKSYGTNRGWQPYTGAVPHTDHVHFSQSWDGAYKRTSYYAYTAPPAPPVAFHPVAPARILDTRPATQVGPFGSPWGQGVSREVAVTGVGGVPSGAQAVALNVTVTGTSAGGYLSVWPAGQSRPVASSLNWSAGQTIAHAVTAKVGTAGQVAVFNEAGSAHVVVDVVGYYDAAAGDGFTPLTPARILDTRAGQPTAWVEGEVKAVPVTGLGGVPAGADAVVANVTVTGTTGDGGFLSIWPSGQPQSSASNLNWAAGDTVANAVTMDPGPDGKVSVFNAAGAAQVIIDVVGWFAPGSGQLFHPLDPARIQDSRPGSKVGPYGTPWGAGTTRPVQVADAGGVPAGADAVLMNVTATGTSGASFLAVWPAGQAEPNASSLNWRAGQTISNAVTTMLSAGGSTSVANAGGNAEVIADAAGWYG